MKILIYGAGAMGLYFAARLAQAGHAVTMKTRTAWEGAPSVTVLGPDQTREEISLDAVVTDLPDYVDADLVVVATKAWQVPQALAEISTAVPESACVMTLQNGISAPEVAHEFMPVATVVATTCVVIVQRTTPGTVQLLGREAQLTMGVFAPPNTTEMALGSVKDAFLNTAVEVIPVQDVSRALWKKLALIASYGGVGAVAGLPVGTTRAYESTRLMVHDAIEECARVAQEHGVLFTPEDVAEIFAVYTDGFEPATTSSMQRDLAEGRPSELDDQTGAVVERADSVGVSVPTHSFIHRALSPREAEARKNQ